MLFGTRQEHDRKPSPRVLRRNCSRSLQEARKEGRRFREVLGATLLCRPLGEHRPLGGRGREDRERTLACTIRTRSGKKVAEKCKKRAGQRAGVRSSQADETWKSRLRTRSKCNGKFVEEDDKTAGKRPVDESDDDKDDPLGPWMKRYRKNGRSSRFQISDEEEDEEFPPSASNVQQDAKESAPNSVHGESTSAQAEEVTNEQKKVEEEGQEICANGTLTKLTEKPAKTPCVDEATYTSSEKDLEAGEGFREGRRCALCGEVETSGSGAMEINKNKVGLGRLLGPFSDKVGVAPVWVHQECAVWSPEVYFHGAGCLKNVRAALRRGRFLKCTKCSLPGATVGCMVRKCPRTYHLPCARLSNCSFESRRYLMSCSEHAHLFKKRSRDVFLDEQMPTKNPRTGVEEKLVDNAEDEEFLKRERKRLHRDLVQLAPVRIGGSEVQGTQYEGWESVGGLRDVVMCLKEAVILPLLYPDTFQKVGIVPPRGVLLHGHPGTGKTLVVRALLGACAGGQHKIAYFARKGADCLGKYVGDAERQLRLLFQLAEQSQPSIIFFDEIDGLAPKRSRHQDQTQSSVVSTLLALMDGLNSRGSVVVIGATNRPDALDPALRRPGRFDREIHFPLPTAADRKAILAVQTRKWPAPPSEDVLTTVSQATVGFAGADLRALCTQAAMVALKREASFSELLNAPDGQRVVPEVEVTAADWNTAMGQAPPPCSRRSLVNALNEIDVSPLPFHMVPVLLEVIVKVLVQLDSDGRLVFPAALTKTLVVIKETKYDQTPSSAASEKVEAALREARIVSGVQAQINAAEQPGDALEGNSLLKSWRQGSFRILITGDQSDGHSFVAASILRGFQASAQVYVLSIQTMVQAGNGNIRKGIMQVLGETRGSPSVVYMPRIDAWALVQDEGECEFCPSDMWTFFLQQTASMAPLMLLATCKNEPPSDILDFFNGRKTVPCACVRVPKLTKSATMEIIDRAATSLSCYVADTMTRPRDRDIWRKRKPTRFILEASKIPESKAAPTASTSPGVQRTPLQDAIKSCGFQLLHCPQFATLRQATSRLRSGPSLTLQNPYTGSWVIKRAPHVNIVPPEEAKRSSEGDAVQSADSDSGKAGDTVWGLQAVGLKASKGFYKTGSEIVSDLQTIATQLRDKVNRKVRRGIAQWRCCQLLTQAAALRDLVDSWAFEMRRMERRNALVRITNMSSEPVPVASVPEPSDNQFPSDTLQPDTQAVVVSVPNAAEPEVTAEEVAISSEDKHKLTQLEQVLMVTLKQLLRDLCEQNAYSSLEELHDSISEAARFLLLELGYGEQRKDASEMVRMVDSVKVKLGLPGKRQF